MSKLPVRNVRTLASMRESVPTDSVEYLPVAWPLSGAVDDQEHGYGDVFALGSYLLDEETRHKSGKVALYQHATQDEETTLRKLTQVETEAVFDLKWCPDVRKRFDCALLGQVDAAGQVVLYSARASDGEWTLAEECKVERAYEATSTISLDWSHRLSTSCEARLAVSHTEGHVTVWRALGEDAALVRELEWKAHDLETWIVAFDYWRPDVLYSGSDDAVFKGWDLRLPAGTPLFQSRVHGAGVTCMQTHPHREHVLVTGSYDESVRLWDTRSIRRPVDEVALGGGVWRLKWHPDPKHADRLLAGCMRNGFHVLQLDGESTGLAVTHSYDNHKDLAYGCDWNQTRANMVASCSFYDHQVDVWEVDGL